MSAPHAGYRLNADCRDRTWVRCSQKGLEIGEAESPTVEFTPWCSCHRNHMPGSVAANDLKITRHNAGVKIRPSDVTSNDDAVGFQVSTCPDNDDLGT